MLLKQRTENSVMYIPVEMIVPNKNQPRKEFKEDALTELALSIMQHGILQPLTVRCTDGNKYELIAGERRLRAAKICGLKKVPCILIQSDDTASSVLALIENLQRCDLNFFEEAEGIARLIEYYKFTQESVAIKLGKSQSAIANKLRILRLPPNIRKTILENNLTERHARALLRLSSPAQQEAVLSAIIKDNLNVEDTDRLISNMIRYKEEKPKGKTIQLYKDIRIFINTINHAVSVMRKSGIEAKSQKNETENYIEYKIVIPKKKCVE